MSDEFWTVVIIVGIIIALPSVAWLFTSPADRIRHWAVVTALIGWVIMVAGLFGVLV